MILKMLSIIAAVFLAMVIGAYVSYKFSFYKWKRQYKIEAAVCEADSCIFYIRIKDFPGLGLKLIGHKTIVVNKYKGAGRSFHCCKTGKKLTDTITLNEIQALICSGKVKKVLPYINDL